MDDILHKVSCIDEDNNCNIVKPYTELEFSLNNPFTTSLYGPYMDLFMDLL